MRTQNGIPLNYIGIRHGNASPAIDGDDQSRSLSEKGIAQVNSRVSSFRGMSVALGLSSIARRASETGAIVFGTQMVELPELYLPLDPTDCVAGDKAFEELGYSSLRTYIAKDTTGWLFRYGMAAVKVVRETVSIKLPPGAYRGEHFVVVAGHAVFTNLVAMLMFPEHAENLQDICLGEAEAFVIGPAGLKHIKG